MRADDLLPLGDQTQDGDFGSRWAQTWAWRGGLGRPGPELTRRPLPTGCGAGVGAECPRRTRRPRRRRRRSRCLCPRSQMTPVWRTWTSATRVRAQRLRGGRGGGTGAWGARGPGEDLSRQATSVSPPEEGGAPRSGSPEVLEEDEAELELQKQLEKGRRLRQLQQLRDSGEKVGGCGGRPGPRGRVGVWWPVLRSTCSCPFVCSTRVPLGSLSRFLLCCR